MRNSLKCLFNRVVTLEYSLPNNGIARSCVSTQDDFACRHLDDSSLSELIYNGIVDLGFEDYNIDITKLDEMQKKALEYKIKYSDAYSDAAKLKLGFYGEVLLNILLQLAFGTDVMVARGQFFDILSNSEACGYDSHHILDRNGNIELWFGETKFYASHKSAINAVWKNASKAISLDYLNRNFQSIIQTNKLVQTTNTTILKFIEKCKKDPYRNLHADIIEYGFRLIYPILIVSNKIGNDYDMTIKECIAHIQEKQDNSPIDINNEIDKVLFFIFLPVDNAKWIKQEVLKCIQSNKPLI